MNEYLKGYGMFIAFMLVTAIVVRPIAQQMGVPLLKDL